MPRRRPRLRVHSLQEGGAFRVTEISSPFARDPRTLLALQLNGDDLDIDHGFPCRLIAPNRPGVFQTKWVTRIEVVRMRTRLLIGLVGVAMGAFGALRFLQLDRSDIVDARSLAGRRRASCTTSSSPRSPSP